MGHIYTLLNTLLSLLTNTLLSLTLHHSLMHPTEVSANRTRASTLLETIKVTLDTYRSMVKGRVEDLALQHTPPTPSVQKHIDNLARLERDIESFEHEVEQLYEG